MVPGEGGPGAPLGRGVPGEHGASKTPIPKSLCCRMYVCCNDFMFRKCMCAATLVFSKVYVCCHGVILKCMFAGTVLLNQMYVCCNGFSLKCMFAVTCFCNVCMP